jgi:septal ring factor EnvC (AmiA/AmiB activator)
MTTLALSLCIVLAIASGILANSLRNRDKELEEMAESYNALRDELTDTQTERAKAIQEREQADRLRDECEKTMRAAMDENDRMMTERKSLYFRNSKGQIQKLSEQ